MEAHACPVKDSGKAKITAVSVTPNNGTVGDTFEIGFGIEIINATGTGIISVDVDGPGIDGMGSSQLNTGLKPGTYNMAFQMTAKNIDASGDASGSVMPVI